MNHVFVMPTHETCTDPAICVGQVDSLKDAMALIYAAGYKAIDESKGGLVSEYDADDAPRILDYEQDGLGAYLIAVKP